MKTIILAALAITVSTSALAVPEDFPGRVPVIYGTSYAVLKEGCPAGKCDAQYLMDAMKEVKKLDKEQLNAYVNSTEEWKGDWGYSSQEVENYTFAMKDEPTNKLTDQIQTTFTKVGSTYNITLTSTVPAIAIKYGTGIVEGNCKGEDYQWMSRANTNGPLYPLGKGESITYKTTCSSISSLKVVTNLGTTIVTN